MNENELKILELLEQSYSGAKMMDDVSAMVRLSRAIAAFKSNVEDTPESIFTDAFLDSYFME